MQVFSFGRLKLTVTASKANGGKSKYPVTQTDINNILAQVDGHLTKIWLIVGTIEKDAPKNAHNTRRLEGLRADARRYAVRFSR
jgi:hypothetical protein